MGRYANFTSTSKKVGHHEYKFWFAIQDSQIFWANEWKSYALPDYDEEAAKYLDLDQDDREYWENHQNESIHEDEFPNGLREAGFEENNAECDDEDLEEYWKDTNEDADTFGLPHLTRNEGESWLDALQRYQTEVIFAEDAKTPQDDKATLARLADLHLKTTICCLLEEWGSFSCVYE